MRVQDAQRRLEEAYYLYLEKVRMLGRVCGITGVSWSDTERNARSQVTLDRTSLDALEEGYNQGLGSRVQQNNLKVADMSRKQKQASSALREFKAALVAAGGESRSKLAGFNISNWNVSIGVDLDPEKLKWKGPKVVLSGTVKFSTPNKRVEAAEYSIEAEENGKVTDVKCSDPLCKHLIYLAASSRQKELAELIEWQRSPGKQLSKGG